jgi:hypothetical protein
MGNLVKLGLRQNGIVDLNKQAFGGLRELEELCLSVDSLECLNQGVFAWLKKLKKLEIVFYKHESKYASVLH